jgi:hypothetical protein
MTSEGIPAAVSRALRQIKAHERVVDVSILDSKEGIVAEVLIDSDLPSRWKADGASPNGVRAVEPVRFEFRGYPVVAPKIHLRADFDRGHPHIQPRGPDTLPEPCLVMGSPSELLRARGIKGLVQQLADWLERAAKVALIDPQQGWEPVRRDHIDDFVICNVNDLLTRVDAKGGAIALDTRHAKYQNAFWVLVNSGVTRLDEGLPARLTDETSIAIVAWPGKSPSGGPFVAKDYEPEDVYDVASLIARAKRLGCGDFLKGKLALIDQRVSHRKPQASVPLTVILIARRPINLIGEDTPYEICPYIIELNRDRVAFGESSKEKVRIAAHRSPLSTRLLRRASGLAHSEAEAHWTLIGAGSVGSKIALHATRAGVAPDIIVDKSSMSPHNYARHGTIPPSSLEAAILHRKTALLRQAIESFDQRVKGVTRDVAMSLFSNADKAAEVMFPGGDKRIVVNATGSIGVREALCLPEAISKRGRVVESSLIGGDRLACLSIEGPGANPSTMDLAMEAHKMMIDDLDYRDLAFDPAVELIAIGQGCSSLTFPMTDARLSALTAPMAERLIAWLTSPLPEAGEICLGVTPEDGMGQKWLRRRIEPWISVQDETGFEVRISPEAHRKIEAEVAAHPRVETGGVLLGRWSDVANAFFVIDVMAAPQDSVFSRAEFRLGVEGLRPAIDYVIAKTRGAIHDVGTWHSHLVESGPSKMDRQTADIMAVVQDFPVLMLIHTPNGYRTLIKEPEFEEILGAEPTNTARTES